LLIELVNPPVLLKVSNYLDGNCGLSCTVRQVVPGHAEPEYDLVKLSRQQPIQMVKELIQIHRVSLR
jgi:hypothetical protein